MSTTPYTVSDVMTHTAVAVGRDAPFKEIARLMEQWKISALPVLAGEGQVIGVVSEADLLPKEEYRDSDPALSQEIGRAGPDGAFPRPRLPDDLVKAGALTAGELMTTPAITVHADATLAQAARVMARRGVKRLPVVDRHGLLEGVVSRSDLLKVFLRDDEDIAEEVTRTVVARPCLRQTVTVDVAEGVVTFGGALRDRSLVPVIARLARGVEGVVDVRVELDEPASAPPPR